MFDCCYYFQGLNIISLYFHSPSQIAFYSCCIIHYWVHFPSLVYNLPNLFHDEYLKSLNVNSHCFKYFNRNGPFLGHVFNFWNHSQICSPVLVPVYFPMHASCCLKDKKAFHWIICNALLCTSLFISFEMNWEAVMWEKSRWMRKKQSKDLVQNGKSNFLNIGSPFFLCKVRRSKQSSYIF